MIEAGTRTGFRRIRSSTLGPGSKQFFFEKKNQKTFTHLVDAAGTFSTHPQEQKFFGSFFQKRTASFAPAATFILALY